MGMSLISDLQQYARSRAKELRDLAATRATPASAEVLLGGQKLTLKLDVERNAAWRLYVELNTRTATQPLADDSGLLREALTSLYAIFGITREILKEAGPAVAQGTESLGFYAMEILNQILRPVLAEWHPALSHWEDQRQPNVSAVEHERAWDEAPKLRERLTETRHVLLDYCEALATLASVSPQESEEKEHG